MPGPNLKSESWMDPGSYTSSNVHVVQNSELTRHWSMVAWKSCPRKNVVNLWIKHDSWDGSNLREDIKNIEQILFIGLVT